MWSDDDGPYDGRHYQLAETLCRPMPVSDPRPRILIGGSGERKTLRLVAQYADACNIMGEPDVIAHKIDVLQRIWAVVGREPA
jgi:alkanesulfonate monooxygenase SsuD/methylene tetrahydromethanopterin reductase-like flavin-dependent oxidoreductase (luciferase family)